MLLNRNIKVPNKNSFYHFIIGLIFMGMSGWVTSSGLKKENGIDQFDWVYIVLFAMVGIYFAYKGLSTIISKAYIRVDDEKLRSSRMSLPSQKPFSGVIYYSFVK